MQSSQLLPLGSLLLSFATPSPRPMPCTTRPARCSNPSPSRSPSCAASPSASNSANSARNCSSTRACRAAMCSAATPATTSAPAAPTTYRRRSVTAGRRGHAIRRRSSTPCSMPRSSGMAAPRTWGAGQGSDPEQRRDAQYPAVGRTDPGQHPGIRGRLPQGLPQGRQAGQLRQHGAGHRGLRGDPGDSGLALRPVSQGRRQGPRRTAEERPQGIHGQWLQRLPQRHQPGRPGLLPVRPGEEARRQRAAQRRQGPLRRDQDPERRVRIPRRAPAQRRPHRAVLPQRPGLGTQGRGSDHGQRPARQAVGAGRRGEHRRLPAQPERQAAASNIRCCRPARRPRRVPRNNRHKEKRGSLEPRFPLWDDLRPRPAPASRRRP